VSREEHVLDASAPLCLLFDQPGADRVERALPEACISAANLAEVIAMLVDRGLDGNEVLADLRELDLEVVALDRAQAEAAGLPRSATRDAGLSLGDWAGLARSAFEVPDPWRPGGLILRRPLHRVVLTHLMGGDQSFSSIIDPTKFTFDGSPGRFWTAPTWNRAQIQIKEIEGTPNCLCDNVLYRTWLCVESRHGRSDDSAHLRDRQHTLQMA
jgi:ribonuclease VapC